jgi:hypothetical protein
MKRYLINPKPYRLPLTLKRISGKRHTLPNHPNIPIIIHYDRGGYQAYELNTGMPLFAKSGTKLELMKSMKIINDMSNETLNYAIEQNLNRLYNSSEIEVTK